MRNPVNDLFRLNQAGTLLEGLPLYPQTQLLTQAEHEHNQAVQAQLVAHDEARMALVQERLAAFKSAAMSYNLLTFHPDRFTE